MKLTRLELSGFKSFADTVTLTFEQGVTAIVGPNGCGKSNVSDAVRWVLGEQSARLLRGGKMEDVIFQGSTARRPVNVTEVSLYLDNSDGDLPIAYREVVVTRRLSRSGQSDYLLNGSPVRLRDIQDLLRGTGLGSDAGVVIEAKMIDLLLSDRADERRSLFEEAAGIGLYRDRKHSTERRLEETATDLQRVEDLIAEVQSQIRSLARQRGKAERHVKLTEEKFAVQVTLARRLLDRLSDEAAGMEAALRRARRAAAGGAPAAGTTASSTARRRRGAAPPRRPQRTEIARRLGDVRVELGKLDGDLALAAERLANAIDAPTAGAGGAAARWSSGRSTRSWSGTRPRATTRPRAVEHERIRAELGRSGRRRGGRAPAPRRAARPGPRVGAGAAGARADPALARGRARRARRRARVAPRAGRRRRGAPRQPSGRAGGRRAPARPRRRAGGLPDPRGQAGSRGGGARPPSRRRSARAGGACIARTAAAPRKRWPS